MSEAHATATRLAAEAKEAADLAQAAFDRGDVVHGVAALLLASKLIALARNFARIAGAEVAR